VLSVEDWAEIRRLHRAERLPIRMIARTLGVSRNTVRAALASAGPPRYARRPAGSMADGVEPRIRELLAVYPTMPATVIAERVGWQHSIRTLSARVAELRPVYLPPDPASRTSYDAGVVAQCDLWFPEIELPVGFGQTRGPKQLPVLTMVTGYSRWLSALLIPSRSAEDLFAGWWRLICGLGAVPRLLVWDGEGAIGRYRRGGPELTVDCQAFRGTLGTKVIVCRPADPEAKGLVERANGYLETSFLPGRYSLPVGLRDPLPFRSEPPADRGEAVIARTDPAVQAIARYVLESALDPAVPAAQRPARRAGVMRTTAVSTRTTLLLVRFRFRLTLPVADGTQQRVAEDARVLAFEGAPQRARWLSDQRAEELLAAAPSDNVVEGVARDAMDNVLTGLSALLPHLGAVADEHADRLLGAHRRARAGAGAARRGLDVTAQRPVDVLSVQVLLPDARGAT